MFTTFFMMLHFFTLVSAHLSKWPPLLDFTDLFGRDHFPSVSSDRMCGCVFGQVGLPIKVNALNQKERT